MMKNEAKQDIKATGERAPGALVVSRKKRDTMRMSCTKYALIVAVAIVLLVPILVFVVNGRGTKGVGEIGEHPQHFQRPDGAWVDPKEQNKCKPGKVIGVESFITLDGTCILTYKGATRNFTCPMENDQGRFVSMIVSFTEGHLGDDINALPIVTEADEFNRVTKELYNEVCHGRRLITEESFSKTLTPTERDEVKTIMKLDDEQLEKLLQKLMDKMELPVVIKREKVQN